MASSSHSSCATAPLTGRILAIDYGRRRVGLALSDALGLTAQPLATLKRTNRRNDLRRLRELVRQHGVQRIVVGHPLHLDGTAGEMAAEAAQFAAHIHKEFRLPVELVDERLSSWEADQIRAEVKPFPRKRSREGSRKGFTKGRERSGGSARKPGVARDQVAAAVILRDYLEHARSAGAHLARGPAKV